MRMRAPLMLRTMKICGVTGGVLIMSALLSAQSLTITSPTAATTWQAGTTQTIAWTIRAPNPSVGRVPVRLLYQVGRSGAWTEIGQIEAFRQKYDWEIPASVSGRVMIRAIWRLSVPLTVNSPTFQIRGIRSSVRKAPTTVSAVERAPAASSDYRLDSVVFQDGRPLGEGIMYSPNVFNDMKLLVRIVWNRIPGRYGIQCDNHKLTILDRRGTVILNPAAVPAPDGNGLISMPVQVRIPRGLREGSQFSFRVRFHPDDSDCDSDASNNERSFSTRLVRMGGSDLVVRVVEAGRFRPDGFLADNQLRVVYEVMNASGSETLRLLKVRVEVEGSMVTRTDARVENLPPGVWKRYSVIIHGRVLYELKGNESAVVTVDPENEIAELREDNNRDGKRFRWD